MNEIETFNKLENTKWTLARNKSRAKELQPIIDELQKKFNSLLK